MIIQSAKYFVGRLVPGLVNLLALGIYTRLLLTEDYGRYALILASVGLTNAIVFQWLNLSLLRFLPSRGDRLLPTAVKAFLMLMIGTSILSTLAIAATWGSPMPALIGLMTLMTWSQAWFEFNLSIVNSRQFAIRHGLISSLKAVVGLGISVTLIHFGFGATGIVVGLSTAMLIASTGSGLKPGTIRLGQAEPDVLKEMFRYGIPLSLTFVLSLLIDATNRFMLNHFHDATLVGAYAAPYDLTNQSLGVLLSAIHLAAFPALLQTYETQGEAAALKRMSSIFNTILLVALPACAFAILFPLTIAQVALGSHFQANAVQLIPFIAVIVSIWGFRSFYIDYAFLVKKKTLVQIIPVLVSAGLNAVLNMVLIPIHGILGTVYSTLISVVIGTILAYIVGWRYLKYPSPGIDAVKILVSVAAMALISGIALPMQGAKGLAVQFLLAGATYAGVLIALDAMSLRSRAFEAYTRFRANRISTP